MKTQKENNNTGFLGLFINILIPSFILMKASGEDVLGPFWGLIAALSLPVVYGVQQYLKDHKTPLLSIIGLLSVLLTGGIGLLELNTFWVPIKEGAIPLILGVIVFYSSFTHRPVLQLLLPLMIDEEKVLWALEEKSAIKNFQTYTRKATRYFAVTFFFSALINYYLATYIVKSPSGSTAFNEELGRLALWSFPVIALPSTLLLMLVVWFVLKRVSTLTGLNLEDLLKVK